MSSTDGGPGLGLRPLGPGATVSVVMPIRNEATFIDRSLSAVLAQDVDPERLEVIVVDGDSDDGTADVVRDLLRSAPHRSTVIVNPARIVPVSMNLALAAATGDVVVRVDGHCVIDPDYVSRCLELLEDRGVECVGGPMVTVADGPVGEAIAVAQSSRAGVGGVAFRTSEAEALVDTVAFGAYRREVFERIGGFDEALVRNQDDELNLRLTKAGGRILMHPAVRSTYFSRGDLRSLARQYSGYGRYKVAVMRKHRTVPSVRHLVPAAFVGAVAGSLVAAAALRRPWVGATVVVPYAATVAVAAGAAARPARVRTSQVAAAMSTMHVAYGTGFLLGVGDVLRGSGPGAATTRTAGPAPSLAGVPTGGRRRVHDVGVDDSAGDRPMPSPGGRP